MQLIGFSNFFDDYFENILPPSVFVLFLMKKRLTIYLIIKRLWVLYPSVFLTFRIIITPQNDYFY